MIKIHHQSTFDPWPLEDASVQAIITSPPYWGLRKYKVPDTDIAGWTGQYGLEQTPELFVEHTVAWAREAWRVLRDDGTLWLSLGDTYNSPAPGSRCPERWPKQSRNDHKTDKPRVANLKAKDLVGIPWMCAFALRAAGWYLRRDIIWHKRNPMPESVKDRPTSAHEYIFLMSKSEQYYYDHEAVREFIAASTITRMSQDIENQTGSDRAINKTNGNMKCVGGKDGLRNLRSVWSSSTALYTGAHFAIMPEKIARICVLAGYRDQDTVLDPFIGSGTTGLVAAKLGRKAIGIDLGYKDVQRERLGLLAVNK